MKEVTWRNDKYNKDMPYTELRNTFKHNDTQVSTYNVFNKEADYIYFGKYCEVLKFVGRKHFTKSIRTISITYKKGKFFGNLEVVESPVLKEFFEYLHIDWIIPVMNDMAHVYHLKNKKVLSRIIDGKITNPEMLYKFILKNTYHALGIIPWKLFAEYLHRPSISIFDILDFTTNPGESLRVILNPDNQDYQQQSLYKDLISHAAILDEKVNLLWSDRRIQEEHQRQIRQVNLLDIEAKDNTPIYKESDLEGILPQYCKLLNTESDTYAEGLTMSNCIYSYWHQITSGRYLAIHFNIEGGCLLGLRVNNRSKKVEFEQCYKAYNEHISDVQRTVVEHFIEWHSTDLYNLINKKFNNEEVTETLPVLDFQWD